MNQPEDEVIAENTMVGDGKAVAVRPVALRHEQLLSDEVNDIISHRPLWIIRNGVTVIAGILVALLVLSWLVLYPDIVQAPLSIMAVNAPKKVVTRTEGKVVSLFTSNGAAVKEGDVLAFLESTGNHADVLALQAWVKKTGQFLNNAQLDSLAGRAMPVTGVLGDLQRPYYDFNERYRKLMQTFSGGFYEQKQKALQNDLDYMDEQLQVLSNQQALAQQDYALQKNEYQTNTRLAKENVIAPLELGREKSKLLAKATVLRNIESQVLTYRSNQQSKRTEMLELQREADDYRQQFSSALFQFASEIDAWVARYVVVAPETGHLEYINALQKNQYVATGQELFYVAPANTRFYGEIIAGQAGIGKLHAGQDVIVELDSHPANEFGYIQGTVESISPFPVRDHSFVVRVKLPQGMTTNYGRTLPYKNNLQARARIVTDDKRLLERLLYMFRQTFVR